MKACKVLPLLCFAAQLQYHRFLRLKVTGGSKDSP